MKKALASMLALLGIHQHLSAEQKQDIVVAAAQATPGAVTAGGFRLAGLPLSDWLVLASIAFVALQAAYLVWKWRRDYVHEQARHRLRDKAKAAVGGHDMSKIPSQLHASIGALLILTGIGGGSYYVDQAATAEAQQNQYIQAVAADLDMPDGMRIAMVMAAFYESSNRHIGTPCMDKLGKGQPLTVCNGLTGKDVIDGKWYSPAECFRLEKKRYVQYELIAKRSLTYWGRLQPFPAGHVLTTRATASFRPVP